ncbi:hypothetical protein JRO89_XS02G0040000 [Xanthoceras sorbifolium]|uniref:AAA+ ATPase domain-containing protein n=1 Tax=Xanthoceras sorbifolium TaxID=99658 RepID=A0ABQ8IEW7_9ROSI|nr:hypothetical protein JRO89_XS02G0040000 [Xanthoceras sorbifolium]
MASTKRMFLNSDKMPSTKTIVSAAASAAATAMLVRTIARDFLPREVRSYIFLKLNDFIASFSSDLTLVIEESNGLNENELFRAAELYLEPIIPPYIKRLKVTIPRKENKVSLSLEKNEEIVDVFNGVHFKWKLLSRRVPAKFLHDPDRFNSVVKSDVKSFELSFHGKHKEIVFATYIPHILEKSKEINEQKKKLKLFTLTFDRMTGRRGDTWQSVNLDHPATFDTLALDLDARKMIMEDLERFVKRKEFYRRVGKAWKRGYLLYGPPGTGKSSLIAAMANYLNFDIYDLELTDLRGNNELRKLLIATENRSILVVEDIDRSIELQDRLAAEARAAAIAMNPNRVRPGLNQGNQVTLSGLLNFIDGLWSSCGDERIIVFTTNHKERLDPALLRPGRMDVHIHMSYCTPCGLKMLASNYLRITEHPLLLDIEELIEQVKVTPAEVGEQLMRDEVPEIALSGLIEFLKSKKTENDESTTSGSEILVELEA